MTLAASHYQVLPSESVPGQPRLRHLHLVVVIAAAIALLAVVITTVVVQTRPRVLVCRLTCGPQVGTGSLGPTAYTSSAFGYRVEYDSSILTVGRRDASGIELDTGGSSLVFSAREGSDLNGAVRAIVLGLDTNVLQGIQDLGIVQGAEIGLVEGEGSYYSANYVPPGGGQGYPVTIVAMACTERGLTITALAVAPADQTSVTSFPQNVAQVFDQAITETTWPGRQ